MVIAREDIPAPLYEICERVGLSAAGAKLLHERANTVYHLPREGVLVRMRRIGESSEWKRRLASATRVTRWLSEQGYPTVSPRLLDPITVGIWTGTFWNYLVFERTMPAPDVGRMGRLIRELHRIPRPPIDILPTNPLGSLPRDIEESRFLSDEQAAWLRQNVQQVAEDYEATPIPLGVGLIHGDAHLGNVFPVRGGYVMGDWDSVSYGPRAQDIVPTLGGVRRFGDPASVWTDFCAAYGVTPDIADAPGIQFLLRAQELRYLAAYIRSAHRDDIRAELDKRLRTLMFDESSTWETI